MRKSIIQIGFIIATGAIIISAVIRTIRPKTRQSNSADLKTYLEDSKANLLEKEYIFSNEDTCVYKTNTSDSLNYKVSIGVPCGIDHIGYKEAGTVKLGKTNGNNFVGLNISEVVIDEKLNEDGKSKIIERISNKKWIESEFTETIYSVNNIEINGYKGSKIIMEDSSSASNSVYFRKWYVFLLLYKNTLFEFKYFVASKKQEELNKIAGRFSVLFDTMVKKVSIK